MPSVRSVVAMCLLLGITAQCAAAAPLVCHNFTGSCLKDGFHCANGEIVPYAKRCDAVEDCLDGTDEYMCEADGAVPLHLRTTEERQAFAETSCPFCDCAVSVIPSVENDGWWEYAKVSPTDTVGLMTGNDIYAGRPCNPRCARRILMAFYKKSRRCRGALCCARQRECLQCLDPFVVGACSTASTATRCYTT